MDKRQDTELIVVETPGIPFRQPSILMPSAQLVAGTSAIFAGSHPESTTLLVCGLMLVGLGFAQILSQTPLRWLTDGGRAAQAMRVHALLSWASGAVIGAIGWFCALSGIAPVQILGACLVMGATALMGRWGGPRYIAPVQMALAILPSTAAWALLAQPLTLVMAGLSLLYLALLTRLVHAFDALVKEASDLAKINRVLAERLDQKRIVLEDQDTQLRSQTVLFDAALSNMAQGLVMFDRDFRVLVSNRRYAELYGLDADVVRPGATLRELSLAAYEAGGGEATAGSFEAFYKLRLDQARLSSVPQKFVGSMADGRKMQINTRPLQGGGFVVTTEDVTEQLRAIDRIAHLAGHDPLTDLVNRSQLPQRLGDALMEAGTKKGGQVAVFCLDLDGFKAVNDTLGHPSGDMLLKAVAGRLRNLVRAGDTVARLGGDEFVCVLTGLKTRKRIAQCAERIVAVLGAPFDLDGRQVKVGASLGIAVAPADGAIAETLLRNADIALYRAIGRVSSEWFSRPADERYSSFSELLASVKGRADRSRTRTVESAAVRVEASRDNAEALALVLPGSAEPIAPTRWSFGQLAGLVGAPAAYLRQLPAALAGINLQYGLTSHRAEQVKTLETDGGRIELRAVTGPDYGRIYGHELVAAVQRIAGNGTGDTRWKVPGVLDWSTGIYNPRVDVTQDTTTLYASDRDVFLFLVDDLNPIEAGVSRTARRTSTSEASTAGTRKLAPSRSAWRASISAPSARTAIFGAWRTSRRSASGTRNMPPRASRMRPRRR